MLDSIVSSRRLSPLHSFISASRSRSRFLLKKFENEKFQRIAEQMPRFYFRNPFKMLLCTQISSTQKWKQQQQLQNQIPFHRGRKKRRMEQKIIFKWNEEIARLSVLCHFQVLRPHIYQQDFSFRRRVFFRLEIIPKFIIKLWEKWASEKAGIRCDR